MFGIDKFLSYYTNIVGEKDGDEDTGELIVAGLFSRLICTDDWLTPTARPLSNILN